VSLDQFLAAVERNQLMAAEQLGELREVVEHYKIAASKLSRFNWRDAFAGAVIGQVLQTAMTAENARLFLKLATDALHWLGTHLHQLPSIHS
jgi:hypothetical protein